MTNRQQWTLIASVVTTAVFGVALAIKLRPQLNPVEIGSAREQTGDRRRLSRQGGAAQHLGDVVPAVPGGNAIDGAAA
jgi:hypothetical protein